MGWALIRGWALNRINMVSLHTLKKILKFSPFKLRRRGDILNKQDDLKCFSFYIEMVLTVRNSIHRLASILYNYDLQLYQP